MSEEISPEVPYCWVVEPLLSGMPADGAVEPASRPAMPASTPAYLTSEDAGEDAAKPNPDEPAMVLTFDGPIAI